MVRHIILGKTNFQKIKKQKNYPLNFPKLKIKEGVLIAIKYENNK